VPSWAITPDDSRSCAGGRWSIGAHRSGYDLSSSHAAARDRPRLAAASSARSSMPGSSWATAVGNVATGAGGPGRTTAPASRSRRLAVATDLGEIPTAAAVSAVAAPFAVSVRTRSTTLGVRTVGRRA
jgi:hypothetical protein